jgi:hypothetical protein
VATQALKMLALVTQSLDQSTKKSKLDVSQISMRPVHDWFKSAMNAYRSSQWIGETQEGDLVDNRHFRDEKMLLPHIPHLRIADFKNIG